MDPWGIPVVTSVDLDIWLLILTDCIVKVRYDLNQYRVFLCVQGYQSEHKNILAEKDESSKLGSVFTWTTWGMPTQLTFNHLLHSFTHLLPDHFLSSKQHACLQELTTSSVKTSAALQHRPRYWFLFRPVAACGYPVAGRWWCGGWYLVVWRRLGGGMAVLGCVVVAVCWWLTECLQ